MRQTPTTAFNASALDPARSIVVEACAGSGKTWLLVSRILRLLLDDRHRSLLCRRRHVNSIRWGGHWTSQGPSGR